MRKLPLFLFIASLLLGSIAFAETEEEFLKEVIYGIRTDLRAALFINDYYLACLNKDNGWFAEHGTVLYQDKYCDSQMKTMKDVVKSRLSLMRQYMGISQWAKEGDSRPMISAMNAERFTAQGLTEFVERDIKHVFPSGAKLEPLTDEEVLAAAEIIRQDILKVKEKGEETGVWVFYPGNSNYEKKYLELITGVSQITDEEGGEDVIPLNPWDEGGPMPVLAFMKRALYSDEGLNEAIQMNSQRTQKLLADFEEDYFNVAPDGEATIKEGLDLRIRKNRNLFFYTDLLRRLQNKFPQYEDFIDEGHKYLGRKMTWLLVGQIGGIVTWAIGCSVFLKGDLAKGLCALPVGLGANIWFVYYDGKLFSEAMDIALYRSDGHRMSGKDLNELNDLKFAKFLSTVMLPFFTGVPNVLKAAKRR